MHARFSNRLPAMLTRHLVLPILGLTAGLAPAATLFSDNFNVGGDAASFDAASTAGRLTGTLASETVLRSHAAQQQIQGDQLLGKNGTRPGGVRFENAGGPFGGTNRYDWAAGSAGADILAGGGFTITFDWTPIDNASSDWVSWVVGTPNADSGAAVVNDALNDYGILFRNNGGSERFDNGANLGAAGSFTTTAGGATTYQVRIDYTFSSFADGSLVTATSTVDGTPIASDSFTWDANSGAIRMELATNRGDNLIDNLTVSSIPEPATGILAALGTLAIFRRRRS